MKQFLILTFTGTIFCLKASAFEIMNFTDKVGTGFPIDKIVISDLHNNGDEDPIRNVVKVCEMLKPEDGTCSAIDDDEAQDNTYTVEIYQGGADIIHCLVKPSGEDIGVVGIYGTNFHDISYEDDPKGNITCQIG